MFGPRIEGLDQWVGEHGVHRLSLVHQETLKYYVPDFFERFLAEILLEKQPYLFVAAATSLGSDLVPRVAAKLKSPLVTNCVEILVKEDLEFIKPVQNGRFHATVVCRGTGIRMATLHPKVLTVSETKKVQALAQVEEVKAVTEGEVPIQVTGFLKADHRTIDIGEAEVIVAVGRGMGSAENFERVQKFSHEMQAAIGGTRPVIDAGILPFERQIGQTGKMVSPKLILLCGISGAMEFAKGIENAGTKVAINTDRQAPIFKSADFGFVADLNTFIPKILTRIEERRRGKKS
jgi:electron transfer flavoprotein alpha subunit